MTFREARSQPASILVASTKGVYVSPPLEWHDDGSVEYTFVAPVDMYVNGFAVAHQDGFLLHESEPEMTFLGRGHEYEVKVVIDPECKDPNCPKCKEDRDA